MKIDNLRSDQFERQEGKLGRSKQCREGGRQQREASVLIGRVEGKTVRMEGRYCSFAADNFAILLITGVLQWTLLDWTPASTNVLRWFAVFVLIIVVIVILIIAIIL